MLSLASPVGLCSGASGKDEADAIKEGGLLDTACSALLTLPPCSTPKNPEREKVKIRCGVLPEARGLEH